MSLQGNSLFGDLEFVDEPRRILPEDQSDEGNEGPDDEEEDDEEEDEGNGPDDQNDGQDDESDDEDDSEDTPAKVFYDILLERNYIAPVEGFDGSETQLDEIIERLPEQYFIQAVNTVNPSLRPLLKQIFDLGENGTLEQVTGFFQQAVLPVHNLESVDIEDEEQAYDYMLSRISKSKAFPTEAKAKAYLDGLVESEELLSVAKGYYDEETEEAKKKLEIEAANAEKARKEKEAADKVFVKQVIDELEALPWSKELKAQSFQNLNPKTIDSLFTEVFRHPKAALQQGAFLSHFNPKTGEFDLAAFAKQAASEAVKKEKDKIEKSGIGSHLSRITSTASKEENRKSGRRNSGGPKSLFDEFQTI